MGNIIFNKLNGRDITRNLTKAISWDESHFCFSSDYIEDLDLNLIFEDEFGLYLDNELIGVGAICFYPMAQEETSIYYIISPSYQNKGYGTLLVNNLIGEVRRTNPSVDKIHINVFKENIIGNIFAKKLGFEFYSSDDQKNHFVKKLEKR